MAAAGDQGGRDFLPEELGFQGTALLNRYKICYRFLDFWKQF